MTTENNPYSIAEIEITPGKKLMKLQYNGMDMMCPFKNRIVTQVQGALSNQPALFQQGCDCLCPHFDLLKKQPDAMEGSVFSTDNISLSCGGVIKYIPIELDKK